MKKIIIGNLKMNLLSAQEREEYFSIFKKEQGNVKLKNTDIILCPPSIHLESFKKWNNKKIYLGAQNIFSENSGSYTGEISPLMVKNLGSEFSIIGHSERRRYFGETNQEINAKIVLALKNGLKPIICVGETKIEKDSQVTQRVITEQVKETLAGIGRVKAENIIIAYEPVWAVGSDEVPTSNEIMEVKVLIRKILVDIWDKKYAEKVAILYGGSVNAKTARQVCVESEMEGALIGRESLTPYEFFKIAEIIDKN